MLAEPTTTPPTDAELMPYFPLPEDTYRLVMGTTALNDGKLIEVDPLNYLAELRLKSEILAEDYSYYYQAPPDTELAQWETIKLLLPDMVCHYPEHFALRTEGDAWTWTNRLLDEHLTFRWGDGATLPLPPLDWLGRQAQEDLILMSGDEATGFPLIAGHLCFASGWCLNDTMGRSFLAIHQRVPHFHTPMARSANLLMARLKSDRPVWRANWSLKTHQRLNAAPRFREAMNLTRAGVTPENAGDRLRMRVERQTLSRLPRSDAILFTIHTYVTPFRVVVNDPERARRFAAVLQSLPEPVMAYKGSDYYYDIALAYAQLRAQA